MDHKDTGELPPVGAGRAGTVTVNDCGAKPWPPDARVRQLIETSIFELEQSIELLFRIADARDVGNFIAFEPRISITRRRHVHECELSAGCRNRVLLAGDVPERLPAERAAEVPEKHQHQGRTVGHPPERLWQIHAAVTADCAQDSSLRASS